MSKVYTEIEPQALLDLFIDSLKQNNTEDIEDLTERIIANAKKYINHKDKKGYNCVDYAIMHNNSYSLKSLIGSDKLSKPYKKNLLFKTISGMQIFSKRFVVEEIGSRNLELATLLLNEGQVSPNYYQHLGYSLLHISCLKLDVDAVKLLLEQPSLNPNTMQKQTIWRTIRLNDDSVIANPTPLNLIVCSVDGGIDSNKSIEKKVEIIDLLLSDDRVILDNETYKILEDVNFYNNNKIKNLCNQKYQVNANNLIIDCHLESVENQNPIISLIEDIIEKIHERNENNPKIRQLRWLSSKVFKDEDSDENYLNELIMMVSKPRASNLNLFEAKPGHTASAKILANLLIKKYHTIVSSYFENKNKKALLDHFSSIYETYALENNNNNNNNNNNYYEYDF